MDKDEIEIFYPTNRTEWRLWLQENHNSKQSVWLVFYKKASKKPSLTWSEAVDEALCFGWIDSKKISIDHEMSHQFFCKRKAKSTWSKVNKNKIVQLVETDMMTRAGLEIIEIAKQNGSWTILDDVEELIMPQDLLLALQTKPNDLDLFLSWSKSVKKAMFHRLVFAKRPETRQKRIDEIIALVHQQQKPKLF